MKTCVNRNTQNPTIPWPALVVWSIKSHLQLWGLRYIFLCVNGTFARHNIEKTLLTWVVPAHSFRKWNAWNTQQVLFTVPLRHQQVSLFQDPEMRIKIRETSVRQICRDYHPLSSIERSHSWHSWHGSAGSKLINLTKIAPRPTVWPVWHGDKDWGFYQTIGAQVRWGIHKIGELWKPHATNLEINQFRSGVPFRRPVFSNIDQLLLIPPAERKSMNNYDLQKCSSLRNPRIPQHRHYRSCNCLLKLVSGRRSPKININYKSIKIWSLLQNRFSNLLACRNCEKKT